MPSAGAVSAPTIIPLRVPVAGKTANQIDTNTLIEIKSGTPGAIVYFSSNGNKPDPFKKHDKSTIKYKGPFLLNDGKRTIKSIAVSRDGQRESMTVSKTFLVEWAPPEAGDDNDDDDQSFIMDTRRSKSSMRSSFADVEGFIDATRASTAMGLTRSYPNLRSSMPAGPYQAWPQQPVTTLQQSPDYLFHYHMHELSPRSRPQPQPQHQQMIQQAPVTVSPIIYGDQNGWNPIQVPLPAFLNQSIGTQTVGLFYPTHEQLTRQDRDVQEVKMLRESAQQTSEKPTLMDTSPGKGYWKRQIAHICAHMEAFTQKDAEFRAEVGKPKMGKITSAEIEDGGVDVTVTISFESKSDTSPAVRPNRASVARQGAISMKQMTKGADEDSPYGKRKKKPLAKKLAAKKKSEDEKLTPEDKALFKEVGPRGEGNPDTVQDLLDDGANPSAENKDGVPVLMVAAMNNHIEAVPVLLDEGAAINAKTSSRRGNTALHESVLMGPEGQEMIELLLECEANPKVKNSKGETPYDLAVKNGYQSITALFTQSMGQDMLNKMSKSKKGKGGKKKPKEESEEDEEEEEEEEDSPRPKKYKEKLPKDKGTLTPAQKFDAQGDAERLRKAMKGFGTDEKTIIEILGQRSNFQRQKIAKQFKQMFGKDLVKEMKGELSGKLWDVVEGLMMTPEMYDADQLHKSIKGLGTDEDTLIEILCTRTNSSVKAIKKAYKEAFGKELVKDIEGDTSGHFQRLLVSVLEGARPEDDEVDPYKATEDATALYKAGEDQWGTDESRFNVIMMSRSYAQLRATFEEYSKVSKHDIEQAIKKEMSGDIKAAMLAVVRCVRNKHKYFADRLYKTMKGAGTDDATLKRILISRCEVDLVNVKGEFQSAYKQTLGKFIAGDTSGDYKKILLALVGGEN